MGGLARVFELRVQEPQIEPGVVRHHPRVAEKCEKTVGDLRKTGFAGKFRGVNAVNLHRLRRHVAFGIDIFVEGDAGRDAVDHLDATDLDDAMPLGGVQPRGLGIDHDLAHVPPRCDTMIVRT